MTKMDKDVDLLIIIPPARSRHSIWLPYGALYVISFLRKNGYRADILNVDKERINNAEVINRIRKIDPRYIGYSGMVATNYKYIKDLSFEIKKAFPDKTQILGGGLACAAEVILKNTPIDIVVYGEGEVTAIELLGRLDSRGDPGTVKGIFYRPRQDQVLFTGKRQVILDLDTIPYPAFDVLDVKDYLTDGVKFIRNFTGKRLDKRIYDKRRHRNMINILTNRGCIGECSFCVRPDAGLRLNSIKYVFDFMKYCTDKFDTGFFSFGDECFAPNKARNWEFIEEYKRRKLDVVFRILGMRVDTVDRDILKAYKDIGCWMIGYGFESGSQKMLNIIDKHVTVDQNRNVAIWTNELGMHTTPQLILGMPGETDQTIGQTIDFLKSLNFDFKQYKWTHALPIPGSHLYNYARSVGAIPDEDQYLYSIGEIEGTSVFHINITDEADDVVARWPDRIKEEVDDHYFYIRYGTRNRLMKRVLGVIESIKLHIIRRDLAEALLIKLNTAVCSILNMKREKAIIQKKNVRYKKLKDVRFEEYLRDHDCSILSRDIALKKINQRVAEKYGAA